MYSYITDYICALDQCFPTIFMIQHLFYIKNHTGYHQINI